MCEQEKAAARPTHQGFPTLRCCRWPAPLSQLSPQPWNRQLRVVLGLTPPLSRVQILLLADSVAQRCPCVEGAARVPPSGSERRTNKVKLYTDPCSTPRSSAVRVGGGGWVMALQHHRRGGRNHRNRSHAWDRITGRYRLTRPASTCIYMYRCSTAVHVDLVVLVLYR